MCLTRAPGTWRVMVYKDCCNNDERRGHRLLYLPTVEGSLQAVIVPHTGQVSRLVEASKPSVGIVIVDQGDLVLVLINIS